MGQVTPLYQRLEAIYDKLAKINHSRHHVYIPTTLGTKAADVITSFVGSWLFVGMHAFWFIAWIAFHPEPFPFGLLTLLVSLEAIFLSTFVMMSQNRQAEKDHLRDDHEAEEVDLLFKINQTQLEILQILRTELCPTPDVAIGAATSEKPTRADIAQLKAPPAQPQRPSAVATPAGSGQSRSRRKRRP